MEGVGVYQAVLAYPVLMCCFPSVVYAACLHELAVRGRVLMRFSVLRAPGADDFGDARCLAPVRVGGFSSIVATLRVLRGVVASRRTRGMGVGLLLGSFILW